MVRCEVTGISICGGTTRYGEVVIADTIGVSVQQVGAGAYDLKLTPNPNNGAFSIKGAVGSDEPSTISISNMLGEIIYKKNIIPQKGRVNEQIQLGTDIANGMYILNLSTGTANTVIHFVVGQ